MIQPQISSKEKKNKQNRLSFYVSRKFDQGPTGQEVDKFGSSTS
jgi:hypothetical protein